jgi:16S rRNA (guanine527-N7)-methyltransferase
VPDAIERSERTDDVKRRPGHRDERVDAPDAKGGEHRLDAALLEPAYWRPELTELLAQTRERGVRCDSGSVERLELYCAELARWSTRVNLVSRREIRQLVSKHIAASMGVFLVDDPRESELWLDIGTGGGFPGMVVKLCRLSQRIALMDSSRKKAVFLEGIREKLQLADLAVIWSRVEEYANESERGLSQPSRDSFAVMVMRAVAPLSESFPLIDALALPGTRLLTYKGPGWEEELAVAKPKMEQLGWAFVSMTPIPWTTSRILKLVKS